MNRTSASIGKALRRLRNKKKISQEELGKALGVSVAVIRDIEQGGSSVTPFQVYKAAEFFGVKVDTFFKG